MKNTTNLRRRSTAACLLAAIGLSAYTPVRADDPVPLTRDAAIAMAIGNNRGLAVAALDVDRAEARLRWAGRLSNPELELSATTDAWGLDEGEESYEISLAQQFPVSGRLKKGRAVGKQDVALAKTEFDAGRRRLSFEVEQVWIRLWAAERSQHLQRKLLDLNNEIVAFMTDRVAFGEVSPLDTVQASLNGKLLEQQLGMSKAEVANARLKLRQLLSLAPDAPVQLADDLAFPNQAPASAYALEDVLANRPDYAALLVSRSLAEAQRDLAEAQRWDDLSVKVFMEEETANDEPVGLEDNTLVGVGLSIPLPFRKQNGQAVDEAVLDLQEADRAIEAKVFDIEHELAAALSARASAHRLAVAAGGEALSLATQNFEDLKTAQQSGLAGPLQVQQAQAQLLQLETSALELQQNYHLANADVRFLTGTYPSLNRLNEESR